MIYTIMICTNDIDFSETFKKNIVYVLSNDRYNFEVKLCHNPQKLVANYSHGKINFNILFIDIFLDYKNGIEIARALRAKGFDGSIVFVSASPDYSLASFDVYPLQYLLKPVDQAKLKEILRRDYSDQIGDRMIRLRKNFGELLIASGDIYYFEMSSRKINIHTDKELHTCNGTLKSLEVTLLGLPFIRCHKGYIVNLDKVVYIRRYKLSISLNKEILEIPVGRAYYDNTMRLIRQKTYTV